MLDQAPLAGEGLHVEQVHEMAMRIAENIRTVILGKDAAIDLLIAALFAGRHVLVEDVPGTGKTTLVKALAVSTGASFSRLQFTPDLLPADVTGTNVWDQKESDFRFVPGPVFSHMVLADEINRASPKTQSSLLESMEERQVTVDGVSRPLPEPFLVLATENPVEYEGTFPLPEAELDRFGIRLNLGYPDFDQELALLDRFYGSDPLDHVSRVTTPEAVVAAQHVVREIYVSAEVRAYLVHIVRATREHSEVQLGASPRATVALGAMARAVAACAGRTYVLPDDVKRLAVPVLAHRLLLRPEARWGTQQAPELVEEIVAETAQPDVSRGKTLRALGDELGLRSLGLRRSRPAEV